jgi:hypothetical protein
VRSRWIAGLAAALVAAALTTATAAGRGRIALEGWVAPEVNSFAYGPRIVWVDPRSGRVRWQHLSGAMYPVDASPDGRLVAFLRDGNLFVGRRLGSRHARLVARGVDDAAWSPDARRLAFTRGSEIRVTGPGLRRSRSVGSGAYAAQGWLLPNPHRLVWSPDGKQIAFFRRIAPGRCASIVVAVLRLRTGSTRTVYRPGAGGAGACDDAGDLAWAPARRLAVPTAERLLVSGLGDVALHTVALGLPRTAFPPGRVIWLPGGRTLAYTSRGCFQSGRCRTYVRTARADGSAGRILASISGRFAVFAMRWWP